jgi:hypothetical protein
MTKYFMSRSGKPIVARLGEMRETDHLAIAAPFCVTPAQAGVQGNRRVVALDSRFRGNDTGMVEGSETT